MSAVDVAALNEFQYAGVQAAIRTPDHWTLLQGMRFNGFIHTVCVLDGSLFIHRLRSMCCNECAWESARDWLAGQVAKMTEVPPDPNVR